MSDRWKSVRSLPEGRRHHCMMLKRSLICTGNTRGKRLVVVLGQKRALTMAVKSKRDERRLSKLRDRLVP